MEENRCIALVALRKIIAYQQLLYCLGCKDFNKLFWGEFLKPRAIEHNLGLIRIKDFENGIDRISLSGVGFEFADLKFVSKAGGESTLIKVNGFGASIYVKDLAVEELDVWDFLT